MSEQRSKTTGRKLCCKKLGTSHDVKSFAIGSFLNALLSKLSVLKNIKNSCQIGTKCIDF